MEQVKAYVQQNRERYIKELIELLKIPSISTEPAHHDDVRQAAQWMAERLHQAGIDDVRIVETAIHPIVYAQREVGSDKPTILFYGHFDVQPAEPLALWTHPPFDPYIEEGRIYARGASDMKANVLLPIIACEALLSTTGTLPFNAKFLLEGEEEIGSPSLATFIAAHREWLTCDLTISADGGVGSVEAPLIGLSSRGLAGLQVRVQTANVDIHSGMGGLAPNALHALVTMLDALRDEEGRILVDGFYDEVRPFSVADQAIVESRTLGMEKMAEEWGIKASFGEPEYTPVQRALVRPTLEVNGMWGGFQGEGVKTVIPHEAFAKLTCRLVAGQDPRTIRERVRAYLERVAPPYATVTVEDLPGEAFPYRLSADHASVRVLQQVLHQATGHAADFSFGGACSNRCWASRRSRLARQARASGHTRQTNLCDWIILCDCRSCIVSI
ncbi:MAG: M20/M25/M40 family metallo-hydrolase [Firmicutes bacterium]|nr:M20/M25/M40 family metallo-hydrolase [Bacillota bacterium]